VENEADPGIQGLKKPPSYQEVRKRYVLGAKVGLVTHKSNVVNGHPEFLQNPSIEMPLGRTSAI
jgi:hypothetical protein